MALSYPQQSTTLLTTPWSPAAIAARIRWLIEHKDKGRVDAAARRLGVRPGDLEHLERALASDAGPRGTELLAAVVQGYRVDACWLLTGTEELDASRLPAEARLHIAHMLLDVANALLDERARQRGPMPLAPDGPGSGVQSRKAI